jgi:hypothetical protein
LAAGDDEGEGLKKPFAFGFKLVLGSEGCEYYGTKLGLCLLKSLVWGGGGLLLIVKGGVFVFIIDGAGFIICSED